MESFKGAVENDTIPSMAYRISFLKFHFVSPLSLAATAAGADGLTIEVHPTPETALSDGLQAITPAEFGVLMDKIKKIKCVLG